jgi:High potential iron-sulfur protein
MPIVNETILISRRRFLGRVARGVVTAPLAILVSPAFGADGPLLDPAEPAAKAVQYLEDARRAKGATAGSKCANCALYLGPTGSVQGPCQIFAGKQVKAAGWCSAWAPQM